MTTDDIEKLVKAFNLAAQNMEPRHFQGMLQTVVIVSRQFNLNIVLDLKSDQFVWHKL